MNKDVPMPPWMRWVQQQWWWQLLLFPVVVGFGTAMLPCVAKGVQNIEMVCFWGAINSTITSFVTMLFSGHSWNSASFHDNGTPNTLVQEAVAVQKTAAATPEGSAEHAMATDLATHAANIAVAMGAKP